MVRFLLALVVIGGVLIYEGIRHLNLASHCHAPPSAVAAGRLTTDGWDNNANVVVSDFLLCPSYVYEKDEYATQWTCVFIPMIDINTADARQMLEAAAHNEPIPTPRNLTAIVKTNAHFAEDADRLYKLTELEGVVINDIAHLSSGEASLLKQSYPGVDLDRLPIIEYKRALPTTGAPVGMLIGGFACLAVGGFIAFKAFRK